MKSNLPLNRSTLRSDAFLSHWYVYTFKAKIILRTQSRCFLEVYSRLVPTISRIVINVDTEFHHADTIKTITDNDHTKTSVHGDFIASFNMTRAKPLYHNHIEWFVFSTTVELFVSNTEVETYLCLLLI